MNSAKPTIVLISGAYHLPAYYTPLRTQLEAQGYPTLTPKLPSVGFTDDASNHSAQNDAVYIRNEVLLPLLNEGKSVVVAMHSYGGLPGSAAAYGLSGYERAREGDKGAVIALVYIAAFVVPPGKTIMEMVPPPLEGASVSENGTVTISPAGAVQMFHNTHPHCANPSFLAPMPIGVFTTPVKSSAHIIPSGSSSAITFETRRWYIHCTEDNAIPIALQKSMVEEAKITRTVTLECDHTPHLALTEKVCEVIVQAAGAE